MEADAEQLRTLCTQLFENAVTHGGTDVTVTTGLTADGFYVEDDGRGIPSRKRDKILEYGYTTESGGTGLGLSIVNSIVTAHGWEIKLVESDEGGARFEIGGVVVSDSE
jgi:signal transduction histidine kinase